MIKVGMVNKVTLTTVILLIFPAMIPANPTMPMSGIIREKIRNASPFLKIKYMIPTVDPTIRIIKVTQIVI